MECFSGGVNRMVCGMGLGGLGLSLVGLNWIGLGLGDCVWCVLLPEFVANATVSSKSTPPVSYG